MDKSSKHSLNPMNLAMLGVLDDFYDVYCAIMEVYDEKGQELLDKSKDRTFLWPNEWDRVCNSAVRKICNPLLNKHVHVFSDKHNRLFANVYGFQTFSFLNVSRKREKINSVSIKYKSFSGFLFEIEFAVARVFLNWALAENPLIEMKNVLKEMDLHINKSAQDSIIKRKTLKAANTASKDVLLHIFEVLSSTSCYRKKHIVTPDELYVDSIDGMSQILLPVHYCNICNKYFVGTMTYSLYEKQFEKMLARRIMDCKFNDAFSSFSLESKLHQLGYNVIDGDMTDTERRNLLVYMLKQHRITYFEICSTLEQNIRLFENSLIHQLAVFKWKDDLKYISEYVLQNDFD